MRPVNNQELSSQRYEEQEYFSQMEKYKNDPALKRIIQIGANDKGRS